MDLESLLKANVELQKRIATDRALRQYFSKLWDKSHPKPASAQESLSAEDQAGLEQLTLHFPREMCELLVREAEASGKSPWQILEDSFAEYYVRKHGPPKG